MKPLVLEKSGPERQLPERLPGASAEALIEHLIDTHTGIVWKPPSNGTDFEGSQSYSMALRNNNGFG
jgi:hypothetical protein